MIQNRAIQPNNRFNHSVRRFIRNVGFIGWDVIFRDVNIKGQIVYINTHCTYAITDFADAIEVILNNPINSTGMRFFLGGAGTSYHSRFFIKIKGYDLLHIKALNPSGAEPFELSLTGTTDLIPEILPIYTSYYTW
jgi:hypothetical protein